MGNSAPKLIWNGDKFNRKGAYSKENRDGYYFYQYPMDILEYVMNIIGGNSGNQLKLMLILLGSAKGFGVSEKTVILRTGMKQQSYVEARKALVKMGIIEYSKGKHTITIDYDMLWYKAKKFKEEQAEKDIYSTHDEEEGLNSEQEQKPKGKFSWE